MLRVALRCVLPVLAGCSFEPVAVTGDGTTPPDTTLPGDADPPSIDASLDCFAAWKTPGALVLSTAVPLANVNSQSEDRDPYLAPDLRTLYFASRRSGSQGADVYAASRGSVAGDFGAPAKAQEFNTSSNDTKLTFSADGLLAFLASDRAGGEGEADIWQAARASTGVPFIGFVQDQLASVNNSGPQLDPAISADALTLYWADGSPQRIVFSRRATVADSFPAPQALIQSGDGDADPALSPDELVIVFASNRAGAGVGGANLWYATRGSKTAAFGDPQPVPTINSNSNEGDPMLSPDGCTLYFGADGGIAGYELMAAAITR